MTGEEYRTAKEISEDLLEKTGIALLAGDFDTFFECFHLPHFIASEKDKMVIENRDQFHDIFCRVTEDYMRKRVTDLIRVCDVAEFRTKTRIEAAHTTHMMCKSQRIAEPFPCYSILEFIDGKWLISASQYAVDTTTTVGTALDAHLANASKKSDNVRKPV
jgi:hypothetical protein